MLPDPLPTARNYSVAALRCSRDDVPVFYEAAFGRHLGDMGGQAFDADLSMFCPRSGRSEDCFKMHFGNENGATTSR